MHSEEAQQSGVSGGILLGHKGVGKKIFKGANRKKYQKIAKKTVK